MNYEVLIPAHNAAEDIARCVRSAKAQEIPPTRVLVHVDGGQEVHETVRAARDAGADEVSWVDENGGIGVARNILAAKAEADFVLYLDSDDELLPHASAAWMELLKNDGAVDVIAGGWIPLGMAFLPDSRDVTQSHGLQDIWWRNPFTSSAALIRRSSLLSAGGFDDGARRLVDYDLWLRMAARDMRLLSMTTPLVARRVSGDTITGQVGPAVLREAELVAMHNGSRRGALMVRLGLAWARGLIRSADYDIQADYPSLTEVGRAGGIRFPRPHAERTLRRAVLSASKIKRRLGGHPSRPSRTSTS